MYNILVFVYKDLQFTKKCCFLMVSRNFLGTQRLALCFLSMCAKFIRSHQICKIRSLKVHTALSLIQRCPGVWLVKEEK